MDKTVVQINSILSQYLYVHIVLNINIYVMFIVTFEIYSHDRTYLAKIIFASTPNIYQMWSWEKPSHSFRYVLPIHQIFIHCGAGRNQQSQGSRYVYCLHMVILYCECLLRLFCCKMTATF